MAKPKYNPARKADDKRKYDNFGTRTGSAPWQATHGMYIAGSIHVEEMQAAIRAADDRWGVGRLRMLVGPALREKFDRQRYLTNRAVWHGELEDLRVQCGRMVTAYKVLGASADAAGAEIKPVEQWEVVLGCGTLLVVVKTLQDAFTAQIDGRKAVVWTLDEVAAVVDEQKAVLMAKAVFPGATVERVDTAVRDPLTRISTSLADLDDPLADLAQINPLGG